MAWCPKCKREYVDDITECKECELELIEGLVEDYVLLLKDENEETVLTIYNYLNETSNYKAELYCDYENNTYEIYALKEEEENIKKAIVMFMQEELNNTDQDIDEVVEKFEEDINKDTKSATYVSAKDKYEERRSSAFSTLFIGIIGLTYMVLKVCGISLFSFDESTDLLFNVTMLSIFTIFTLVGIFTFISANKIKKTIQVEENLIDDLKAFMDEKITAEGIDAECNFTDETEELKYFARQSCIKEKIYAEFEIQDETMIDQLIDEYYPLIFTTDN